MCVNFAVDDESVQLGKFGDRSDDGGNNDGQMAELYPLFSGFQDVIVYVLVGNGDGDRVLRVTAFAHKIGGKGIHGVNVFYSFSIGSHNICPFLIKDNVDDGFCNGRMLLCNIIEDYLFYVKF